jgi:D-glycero-beta-D-manno-heptose 1-phosphate adenylyltransferase
LNDAAKLGSVLVVGINSDRSVRLQNKGPDRPINSDLDRAFVLAGLVSVDYVTFFDELTPIQLVGLVRPDIYVKGGDYQIEELDEAKLVKSWGGVAYSISYIEGFSSTSLINRIRNFEI